MTTGIEYGVETREGSGKQGESIPDFAEYPGDGEIRLNLHPGQVRAWESEKRFIFMQAGTQSGKTIFGPHWLSREMDSRGPGDYMAVTATYPLLELKMLPELKKLFITHYRWGEYKASSRVFESHAKEHGAPAWRIILGSATNPESLESATAKAAWLDEVGQHQFNRGAWEAILRRLSIAQGRVLGTTTLYEIGWYKMEVYDRWVNGDPDIDIIQIDSIVNPYFSKEEYYRSMATLPRWKFNMFYRGLFEKPAGLIYDSFNEEDCVIPRFPIPDATSKRPWLRYCGHDFGPNNTAALWYAQDPDTGFLYVYRAYLDGGLSAYDHAQKFKSLSENETIIKRVGGAHVEDGWREAFTAAGWPISEPRENGVEVGINTVYGWHSLNRIFVFNDVTRYLDEKLSYSRKLDEMYEPTAIIDNKSRFHLMDAERYIISDFGPERVLKSSRVALVQRRL